MSRKIPKNLILTIPPKLKQNKLQPEYNPTSQKPDQAVLLKYYPKYCHQVHLDKEFSGWKTLSRIKQIKTISEFQYFPNDLYDKKKIIRILKRLLKNKRKSIKYLPHLTVWNQDFEDHREKLEMCSFFPRIKVLDVHIFQEQFPQWKKNNIGSKLEAKKALKAYGYFCNSLRYVEYLNIPIYLPYIWVVLKRLQSAKGFFQSLKVFSLKISSSTAKKKVSVWAHSLIQTLAKQKEFLKYVTHFDFEYLQNCHSFKWVVKEILAPSSNLIAVSFPIGFGFPETPEHQDTPSPLAPLQSIPNLKELTLKVSEVWGFLGTFEAPPMLQKLTLDLGNIDSWALLWKELYPPENKEKDERLKRKREEKEDIFIRFFERIRSLSHLISLDLKMPPFIEANEILKKFILPLLAAIPKLEKFNLEFSFESKEPLELSIFLDGIVHLQHLKAFGISHQKREDQPFFIENQDLIVTFNPQKTFAFPNILSVNINAFISKDFDFQKFLTTFSAQFTSTAEIPKRNLNLSKIVLESVKDLNPLLKIVRLFKRSQHIINLEIVVDSFKLQDITDNFKSPITLLKNIIITLDLYASYEIYKFKPKEISIIQNIFRNFTVNVTCYICRVQKDTIPRGICCVDY